MTEPTMANGTAPVVPTLAQAGDTMVIFDVDDTLVDTRRAVMRARSEVLRCAFPTTLDDPAKLRRAQAVWTRASWYVEDDDIGAVIDIVCAEFDVPRNRVLVSGDELLGVYEDTEIANVVWHDGAAETIGLLQSRGHRLALLTNGDMAKQLRKLQALGYAEGVDGDLTLILPTDRLRPKPCADGVRDLCRRASMDTARTVVVGDRTTDVIAANLADARSVLVMHESVVSALPSTAGRLRAEIPSIAVPTLAEVPEAISLVLDTSRERRSTRLELASWS